MNKEQPKKGDKVYIDGYTSIAQQNARETTIEEIEYRFDEITGEKFPICLVDGHWFDWRFGTCYDNKDSMYYIEPMGVHSHELESTLSNLKDFKKSLEDFVAPANDDGWSLSNLPTNFWETLGECISDIENHIKNEI